MKHKKRLDLLVQETFPHLTRNQIQSFIMQGKVSVDGKIRTKPGESITVGSQISLSQETPRYVCRAGWKLEKALSFFNIDPQGMVILDAGLSTGGFTDCLLQQGAARVYGVDVGYGQVHEKIRTDPRVIVMERTNLRYLESLPEQVDLVTLDLSFISLTKVIPAVKKLMKPHALIITLIKPQFEAQKEEVGKGGIIRDPAIHKRVVDEVLAAIAHEGFIVRGITDSPIQGTSGNKEFLAAFQSSV